MMQGPPSLNRVSVIGAGLIGSGVAASAAAAGYEVTLYDINPSLAAIGLERAKEDLAKLLNLGRVSRAGEAPLLKICSAVTPDDFNNVDLVIEAVTENELIKRSVFENICPLLKKDAILATTTSTMSITRLASATDRPDKFLGLHFMNPVVAIPLVEVVRGINTDERTLSTVNSFVSTLGKTIVTSEDFPGFMVNRILMPMINEAIYALHEGVASISSIDDAMKYGANHPMGPLQLADFLGLDFCLSILQSLYFNLSDNKYRPCPLLIKYVEAGWVGRKVGRGFYDYGGELPRPTR